MIVPRAGAKLDLAGRSAPRSSRQFDLALIVAPALVEIVSQIVRRDGEGTISSDRC